MNDADTCSIGGVVIRFRVSREGQASTLVHQLVPDRYKTRALSGGAEALDTHREDAITTTSHDLMRILHVFHTSLPVICGYSIRSGHILRLEKARGHDLLAVTSAQHPSDGASSEEIEGVEHRRTPSHRGSTLRFLREWQLMLNLRREVLAAASEWKPDLIHAHSPVLVGLPAQRAAQRMNLPIVYEVRDLWENAAVDRGRFSDGSVHYRLARAVESRVLRQADAVVTICEALRNELATRRRRTVHVVANGVDAEAFAPRAASASVRDRYGLDGRQAIVYAGTFQPYEGLRLLIRAMARIAREQPRSHLLLVGGSAGTASGGAPAAGTEDASLAQLVRTLGLDDHVTMTGRVSPGEVADLYSVAQVAVYPRLLTRTTALTTPLKPLEAMALGKAVVVSDAPAMRELVRGGETGVTFAAGDKEALAVACVTVLRDENLRERLGRSARDFVVRERQWSDLVGRYDPIYESVVDGRGGD